MKLKLCINVLDISLYINCIFFLLSLPMCFRCYGNSNFPYTCSYNGKSVNWHLFLCYCRYFDKILLKCFWSSPLSTIWSLSKSLILTGGYGNRKAKISKKTTTTKHSKIFFSEAIWGMKLKLCINVYDISLYIKCVFIAVAHVFSLLWQLKVSIDL